MLFLLLLFKITYNSDPSPGFDSRDRGNILLLQQCALTCEA